jgi:hypothetical protein
MRHEIGRVSERPISKSACGTMISVKDQTEFMLKESLPVEPALLEAA